MDTVRIDGKLNTIAGLDARTRLDRRCKRIAFALDIQVCNGTKLFDDVNISFDDGFGELIRTVGAATC